MHEYRRNCAICCGIAAFLGRQERCLAFSGVLRRRMPSRKRRKKCTNFEHCMDRCCILSHMDMKTCIFLTLGLLVGSGSGYSIDRPAGSTDNLQPPPLTPTPYAHLPNRPDWELFRARCLKRSLRSWSLADSPECW